ncbi:MAG: hemerythrin family protein [Magnetococcus sp. YQC-3]
MDLIEWKSGYSTGNKDVDLQHQYFANLINRINQEFMEQHDYAYQVRLLQELHRYAVFHFFSEENIFLKLGFNDLESHERLHQSLLNELNSMIKNSVVQQNSPHRILQFLTDWFIEHTTQEDIQDFAVLNQKTPPSI